MRLGVSDWLRGRSSWALENFEDFDFFYELHGEM